MDEGTWLWNSVKEIIYKLTIFWKWIELINALMGLNVGHANEVLQLTSPSNTSVRWVQFSARTCKMLILVHKLVWYINIYLRRLLLDIHLSIKNRIGYSDSRERLKNLSNDRRVRNI